MARRLLGPIGGPIVFFLVAGLVFAGLGWVTFAALRVEEAQREAARRADHEKELRIALWRMDARMLPALGVEDTRPFHEFKTFSADDPITIYGPASAPLIAGELPEWMKLHFQLDPDLDWESPQVLSRETKLALRRHWPELPLRNSTQLRDEQLGELNSKFPPRATAESFAARERTLPVISPPSAPLSFNFGVDGAVPADPRREADPVMDTPPPAPVNIPLPAPAAKPAADALFVEKAETQALKDTKQRNRVVDDAKPQAAAEPRQTSNFSNSTQYDRSNTRNLDQNRSDYDERESLLSKAFRDTARFKYQLVPGNSLQLQNGLAQKKSAAGDGKALADLRADKELRSLGASVPQSEFKSDSYGFMRLLEEARSREVERKQLENLHRGALKKEAEVKENAAKDAMAKGGAAERPSAGSPAPGFSPPPAPGLPFGGGGGGSGPPRAMVPGAAPPGGPAAPPGLAGPPTPAAPPAGFGGRTGSTRFTVPALEPQDPTPDPMPPARLLPADPPVPAATGEEAVAPPVAVHLGTLRPQWLTAPDGTPLLVLVRTARVENRKTLYQGVVLDWVKLQALLHDEVKDLFPAARLEPVKEGAADPRERSMTVLPVRLDPGAEEPLPPAGWTPLRIGLVLAWVAAVVAFAAIGLTGWSLVDLAERRIRFVSAVTHELRTPLTSLRLYLDLLLSGMVQDEDKRREYLSTLNVESDRLHRLIDNVLDFAKLERSRKGKDLHPVKAAELLDSIRLVWLDRVAADGKELIVSSSLPDDLGITTDGTLVQQIVGNLIDNARKYTRDAEDARIWLRATVDGSRLVFEVEDRGCGVSPREQKTIFRPFRRGDSADTRAGGAGLGLALSKDWAEVLGGRLLYRTPEAGVGSCFRLELPIKS